MAGTRRLLGLGTLAYTVFWKASLATHLRSIWDLLWMDHLKEAKRNFNLKLLAFCTALLDCPWERIPSLPIASPTLPGSQQEGTL